MHGESLPWEYRSIIATLSSEVNERAVSGEALISVGVRWYCQIWSETIGPAYACVSVEPALQPLTGEELSPRTAICDEGAHLDVCAHGFWGGGRHQHAFFYVRVFN